MKPFACIAASLLIPGWAIAAEVTDVAPRLGMLAGLAYGGSSLNGGLTEDGVRVADRRISRHDLDLLAEFAPTTGLAVTLRVQITPSMLFSYPNARSMVIEPLDGSGSYLAGDPSAETPTVKASGVAGVWLGVAAAPFSELTGPANRSSWRLDFAVRTPSPKRNLWSAPGGTRGVSPGGTAIRLAGAFSVDRGVGNPYLSTAWQRENAVKVDVTDEAGVAWAQALQLNPADEFRIRGGIEIVALDREDTSTRVAVDPSIGVGYRSWEDVASGVYLPNVLEGARAIPVTVGDQLLATVGLGLDLHLNESVRARTGLDFEYRTPFRVEHVYPVSTTPDTWQIGWSVKFQGVPVFDAGQ